MLKRILSPEILNGLRRIKKKLEGLRNFIFPTQEYNKLKEEAKWRSKFYSQIISKGDLCFDVGANYGNRIAPLLFLKAKVVAIEPQEKCYSYLMENYGKKIKIETKGLSDKEGFKDFYLSNETTISSFSKDWIDSVKDERFKGFVWNEIGQVEMTTLDKLIEKYGKPQFIKIDVEGFELEVLKGLSQPVKVISYEYTTPEQTTKAVDCLNQIYSVQKDIKCNYSIGESMEFALKDWITYDQMITLINTENFVKTGFGDIYIKNASL